MTSSTSVQATAPAPAKAPTCGGCFKPVDPETSVKRPIYGTASSSRYGRYSGRAPSEPVTLHFCNIECRQRADTAHDTRGGYF